MLLWANSLKQSVLCAEASEELSSSSHQTGPLIKWVYVSAAAAKSEDVAAARVGEAINLYA